MDGEARLLAMQARPDGLGLLLDAGGTHLTVDVGLSERSAHALHHLHVLHGGGHPCAAAAQRQAPVVDALLRAVRAVGGTPRALVVRGGVEPAFWLRVDGPDGGHQVPGSGPGRYCVRRRPHGQAHLPHGAGQFRVLHHACLPGAALSEFECLHAVLG